MQNRLKAHVRKVVLYAANLYAMPKKKRNAESTASAFVSAARGLMSGWWDDLATHADTMRTFNRYRADCGAVIVDVMGRNGHRTSDFADRNESITYADMLLVCCAYRPLSLKNDPRRVVARFTIRFAIAHTIPIVAKEFKIDVPPVDI